MIRYSSPSFVQALWDGIQEQQLEYNTRSEGDRCFVPLKKLTIYLKQKLNYAEEKILADLRGAQEDYLVVSQNSSHRNRNESDLYGLPDPEEFRDKGDHAWYCFDCRLGQSSSGDATWCTTCPRIYHRPCLGKQHEILGFVCKVCKALKSRPSAERLKISKEDLNTLIKYSCSRFYQWKDILMLKHADGRSWAKASGRDEATNAWRYDALVYSSIDLSVILKKATEVEYTSLEEYWLDCSQLVHNVAVYFGCEALKDMDRTGRFLKSFIHDVNEIQVCPDCFRYSNELQPDWFALPCRKPHDAVWAKLGRYPYWPAKVIRMDFCGIGITRFYDVRFFGDQHERARLVSENIKPIHTSWSELGIGRKTKAWERAYKELQKFQQLAAATKERPTSINGNGSTFHDVAIVSNPERTEGCILGVLDENQIVDATPTTSRKRGIIKINNHEATPTGSESPKRKKSVKFVADCNVTAEEVKNHEKNENPTIPEATSEGEATFDGACDDSPQSPQQQVECLVEESNQADGAGQGSVMETLNEDTLISSTLEKLLHCEAVDKRDVAIVSLILGEMKGCRCEGCLK